MCFFVMQVGKKEMNRLNSTMQSTVGCNVDYGLVSIIMPNYNGEKYLNTTIESVIGQEYQNWELLFVDDCSTDLSIEIVQSYRDKRIKIYRNDINQGAAVARNRALEIAQGRWIAFLDSDDVWKKNKLHYQLKFMVEKKIAFSFTPYTVIKGGEFLKEYTPSKDTYDYKTILRHCYIGCSTVIYDREKLGIVYMPIKAKKREDYACWLKILKDGESAFCFHENLTTYNIHSHSVSANKFGVIKYQWNVYRKIERLPLLNSIYYMLNWAYFGFLKYR